MSVLAIRDLEVRYGGIAALRGVSLQVSEAETVILVGANGAGKSSLINGVIGLAQASAGTILFQDRDIRALSCNQRARLGIGYSPEGRRIFPNMTVAENVLVGAYGLGGRRQQEAFDWLCDAFPLLGARSTQLAGQLSGGEQQIVALARAMSSFPRLLLLDEPFLGLAPVWIEKISDAIRLMQRRGTTILLAEQMARPAMRLATRGYVMRNGEIRREGNVEEIRSVALADEYL